MGQPEIKFGDKIFLYGQYLSFLDEYDDYSYNSLMGYMTIGGYEVFLKKIDDNLASVPGFLVEIASLASQTPFVDKEMVDVTKDMALSLPLPVGARIWAPTIN